MLMPANLLINLQTSGTFSLSSCTYIFYKVNEVLADELAFLDVLFPNKGIFIRCHHEHHYHVHVKLLSAASKELTVEVNFPKKECAGNLQSLYTNKLVNAQFDLYTLTET